MKKALLLFFWFVSIVGFGQCPTGSITLSSQAEVDAFTSTYPGCSHPQGLIISGVDIVNLSPLAVITEIGIENEGGFEIKNNPLLTNLAGLENLTSISYGNFVIENNPELANITALSGLTGAIGYSIIIKDNPALISLNGLQNITQPGDDDLHIENNDLLTDLTGLHNIIWADDTLIMGNDGLSDLTGLSSLTQTGSFIINGNINLYNLNGIVSLEHIYGLEIDNNPVLNNISSFTNVDLLDCYILMIANNPQLSECSITSICQRITINEGEITISNNAENCNTQTEVETRCQLYITETYFSKHLSVFPNPVTSILNIEISNDISFQKATIFSILGNPIMETKENQINLETLSAGIYLVEVFTDKGSVIKKIVKQ